MVKLNGVKQPEVWRNRITGHGEEAPDQLLANPSQGCMHTLRIML